MAAFCFATVASLLFVLLWNDPAVATGVTRLGSKVSSHLDNRRGALEPDVIAAHVNGRQVHAKPQSLVKRNSCELDDLRQSGVSPGAQMKLRHFREAFDLATLVFTMRKDAARRCAAGEQNDCQSMQSLEMLGLAKPNPMPQIGSFHLSSSCFEVGDGDGDQLGVRGPYRRISRPYDNPLTRVTPTKQGELASVRKSSDVTDFSSSAPRAIPEGEEANVQYAAGGHRRKRVTQDRLPVFTETGVHDKAFAAAGAKARIFDLIKSLFGSGSDITDPDNFEGGNQGSYFDFMYPLNTDYPWACVCDEGQYVQWQANEIQAVPCRNQVDMSAQGITAACNPSLHKMNHAAMTTKGWQSAVCSVISISVGFWFV